MSQNNSDLAETIRKILHEERVKEETTETIKKLEERVNKLYSQLAKQTKKVATVDDINKIESTVNELKQALVELARTSNKVNEIEEIKQTMANVTKALETLAKHVSKTDELANAISNITKEISELKKASQELEEVKKKVEHKHIWEDKGGVLACKDCGEMIPIPKSYVKVDNTEDLLSYMFKKHRHGDEEYNNIFECPHCREDLINLMKKNNFNVTISGDELRLKVPRKK